jgi:DNA-directed RNA polymerase specialized sigma24 family protein
MREPQHDTRRVAADHLPPFWILARDSQGRPVDPRVVAVAERLWPWAYRRVERELHDPASAAQLVEGVALEVSSRLQDDPAVGQNLAGYFITAFHREVRQQFLKENRVTYEGLLRELELNHHLTAPDWEAAMERELCLKVLVDQLPHQSRHMLHYRILGFTWNEIGRALRISGKQARSRFYYELDKVHGKLLGNTIKGRPGHPEESD